MIEPGKHVSIICPEQPEQPYPYIWEGWAAVCLQCGRPLYSKGRKNQRDTHQVAVAGADQ